MLRIEEAVALEGFTLKLVLTDGTVVKRDVAHLLKGPVFDAIREDARVFRAVRAEGGTVVWPNGADLCPDVLIWGGPPPADGDRTQARPAEALPT